MLHDRRRLEQILKWLEAQAITTWLFGGWAEQFRGLCEPRLHVDVDLMFVAEDFGVIDAAIQRLALDEIQAKRFTHKRAIVLADVMVELFLLQRDERGAYTNFWGNSRLDWPRDVLGRLGRKRVASTRALLEHRAAYTRLHAFHAGSTGRPR